jgi:hypothetical protein
VPGWPQGAVLLQPDDAQQLHQLVLQLLQQLEACVTQRKAPTGGGSVEVVGVGWGGVGWGGGPRLVCCWHRLSDTLWLHSTDCARLKWVAAWAVHCTQAAPDHPTS